jgi:hypothetical protein
MSKQPPVPLRDEPQPDPEALRRLAEIEADEDLGGLHTDDPDEPLAPLIDLLQQLLPGFVHGFSPSAEPDRKTPTRSKRVDRDGRPVLSDEFIKCLQRRVRLGQSLQRPEDRPRMLPGPNDT